MNIDKKYTNSDLLAAYSALQRANPKDSRLRFYSRDKNGFLVMSLRFNNEFLAEFSPGNFNLNEAISNYIEELLSSEDLGCSSNISNENQRVVSKSEKIFTDESLKTPW